MATPPQHAWGRPSAKPNAPPCCSRISAQVALPEPPRAALASFVYNVGEGNFARSTLLRKLNQGDLRGACHELSRWVYAGGRKLNGLVSRRATERELCLAGLAQETTP